MLPDGAYDQMNVIDATLNPREAKHRQNGKTKLSAVKEISGGQMEYIERDRREQRL